MKTNFEEIMYKAWLKSEIIKQNKIFNFKKDNREINIQTLINHVFNTNSKIAKKMREKTIDINGDISRDELMNFLSHTNKGDIIRWENSEGQKMYFLNRGKKLNGKKDILVLGENINKDELDELKKTFLKKVIEKDIKKVQREIQQEKERKRRQIKKIILKRGYELPTSSNFERNMIKAIQEGFAPENAAGFLLPLMSENDKKALLSQNDIQNANDFENYIESLKEKASCHKSFIKTFPSRGQLYSNRDSSIFNIC